MTTDGQCTQAAEQTQLWAEWMIVQVGAGQPRPRGLPRGTTLLVATAVPHDSQMAVHTLQDQPEDAGQLVEQLADEVVVVVDAVELEAEERDVGDGGGSRVAGAGAGCWVL